MLYISQFKYKVLVSYKKGLVNNHARLKACSLEHKMSNTPTKVFLVSKLPIQEAVEWQKLGSRKPTS